MKTSKARILVIDEEPFCVWIIQNNLESQGYQVLATEHGHTAIDLVVSWAPDLIILSSQIPDLNGFEICQRIREFSTVPLIILTAQAKEPDDIVKGLQLGADDCLTKPFSIDELVARVRALLRRVEFSGRWDPVSSGLLTGGSLAPGNACPLVGDKCTSQRN